MLQNSFCAQCFVLSKENKVLANSLRMENMTYNSGLLDLFRFKR